MRRQSRDQATKGLNKLKTQTIILEELNSYLRRDLACPELQFVSFTSIKLNEDLSQATAYWDTFDFSKKKGIEEKLLEVLPRMRKLLSSKLQFRHTPSLKFFYNSQFEDENRIMSLISSKESELSIIKTENISS